MLTTRNNFSEVKTYLGLALLAVASKQDTPAHQQNISLKEACALLADSVAFAEEVRAAMPGAIDEDDAQERIAGLARCQAQLAKLGSR